MRVKTIPDAAPETDLPEQAANHQASASLALALLEVVEVLLQGAVAGPFPSTEGEEEEAS